jgi:uncharacterized protein (DUF433 family)
LGEIVKDTNMVFGQPTLKGRRLTVSNIVTGIDSDNLESYITDHEISETDAEIAVKYCINRDCTKTIGKFCEHCILSDAKNNELDKGWEIAASVYHKYWKKR